MTPDKRVEEIVREFFERNDCIMCYGKEDKQRERLTQTLQAERTKRDEMVEELKTIRSYLLNGEPTGRVNMGGRGTSDYYQQGQLDILDTVINKLTQPNNQN